MPLDPQVQALLERVASGGQKPIDEIPIDEGRAVGRMLALFDGEPEPVVAVEDRRIPGPAGDIVVRVYRPTEEATALPAVAWFRRRSRRRDGSRLLRAGRRAGSR